MNTVKQMRTAWAHSDCCTGPCRTRSQGTFGRRNVRTWDPLGGRKLVVNLTGLK